MNTPQPIPGDPNANQDRDDDRRRRRLLALLLLLLLLVPVCLWIVSQLALLELGMDEAHESLLSQLQATYVPWAPSSFGPLDPTMIGTIRAEQATFAAGGGGIGILVPFISGGSGQTQIAANASATPTVGTTPVMTATSPITTTPIVIYYPGTSTVPAVPPPTLDMSTPTAGASATLPPAPPATNTPVPGTADLSITKTNIGTTYTPNTSTTYTIEVTNKGPLDVSNARVIDTLPPQIDSATWTCLASGGSSCPANGSGDIDVMVNLLNGGTATFTVTANISATATGDIVNTATVTPPANRTDPLGNNTATDTDALAFVDLAVTKTDGKTTALRGHSVTYTIFVSNIGTAPAAGATVTDTLPPLLTAPISWTCTHSAGATCTASGTGNISDIVAIPAGGNVTYVLTAVLAPSAVVDGLLSNTASVSAPGDTNTANDSRTDTDTIKSLSITLTWNSGDTRADLDLWVVDPSAPDHLINTTIVAGGGPSSSGGALTSDTNCTVVTYTGNEQVTWPGASYPLSGTYRVYVYYYMTCPAVNNTISWTLTIDNEGTITTYNGDYTGQVAQPVPADCPGFLLLPSPPAGNFFTTNCTAALYDPSSQAPFTATFTIP